MSVLTQPDKTVVPCPTCDATVYAYNKHVCPTCQAEVCYFCEAGHADDHAAEAAKEPTDVPIDKQPDN